MSGSKRIATAIIVLASFTTPQPVDAAPGYMTSTLKVQHRTRPLDLHIWYPTDQGGQTTELGKNAVFTGIKVRRDVSPRAGKHPLVLLSHGSGGNAVNIGWIAAELADRGIVVIATNHPGTTSRDSLPKETIKVWERPTDLSAIVDHAEQHGIGAIQIDQTKIGAVGFSLGGHSVLSLAGAEVRKQKFVDYCKRYSSIMDCQWLKAGNVDLNSLEPERFEQSNLDKRFKVVVAIDPALAQAYDHDSVENISTPIRLINLGDANHVPAGVNASTIISHFRDAQLIHVSQATHFSFLGECTQIGEAIIASESEEPICTETGNRKRTDIHTELKTLIGDFLEQQFLK